jgi:ABC-type antimicrobial peptide transport system permease subunit
MMVEPIVQTESGVNLKTAIAVLTTVTDNVEVVRWIESPNSLLLFLLVRRFAMEMVAFFAATALLLAGLGIYGTISYVVDEQRREIAIRLALGDRRGNILKMVLRRGLGLAAAGAGLGVAGALIVSHLMSGLLYGVSPADLPTFAGVTLVLTTVALARQLYSGATRHAPRSRKVRAGFLSIVADRDPRSERPTVP